MSDIRPATSGKQINEDENSERISTKENRVNRSQQQARANETMKSCELRIPFGESSVNLSNQE